MNGFGITDAELELARKLATDTIRVYGDFDDASHHQFVTRGIWNDHVSVQTAIAVIKHYKAQENANATT